MKLNRGEPDHSHWKTPYTFKEKANVHWGLGACFFLLGYYKWSDPPKPPFIGRWGWIDSIGYDTFGEHGPALVWYAIGFIMLGIGLGLQIKHSEQNSGKHP